MQDDSLPTTPAPTPDLPELIAPWWHTIAILVLLATWAALSGPRKHSYDGTPHPLTYIGQIMMSWMLFGTVIAGIIDRRAFFRRTLTSRYTLLIDAARGLGVYIGIYAFAVTIAVCINFVGLANKAIHHQPLFPELQQTQPGTNTKPTPSSTSVTPPPAPATPDPLAAFKHSRFHFDPKTVLALAPSTPFELLLWVLISLTAGFCEEHIFRGYLLAQALAITRRIGLSPLIATILSVIATSLIFGSLHLYEGLGGAALISILGAIYCIVALKLRNLRAVMAAHFLQDFVAGFFLFLFHSFYSRLLAS